MNQRVMAGQGGHGAIVSIDPNTALGAWNPAPASHSERLTPTKILNILYRWRWLFLALVVASVLAAAAWAAVQTPLYRAVATLELNPAPSRVVQSDVDANERVQYDSDFLALQLGLVKSRALAERVAAALSLSRDEAFLRRKPKPEDTNGAVAGQLMAGFAASGTTSDRIMQVSFVHPDPAMAAKVTNSFAEQAMESNFDRAFAATTRSRQFLQRRLEATRRDLENSERALIEYARRANIINVVSSDNPTSGDSAGGTLVASNLVSLNEQLADAQNARIVAQQRYAQAGAAGRAAQAADGTVQALQQQKAQLQSQYDEKAQIFQPDYPEMVTLRARIQGLDRQIAASSSRASSAVQGSLRAEMIAAQNRENALQARIKQLESRFLDLNDRGVQYTILRRSVDANRTLYNALLGQLGSENSSATRTNSVAIIDKAKAPDAPFAPNIPRTMLLGLLGGLVLGSAGALSADRFYDTLNTPDDLKSLGLPLLGVVPIAPKDQTVDSQIADPKSPIAEAFHSTRASLQFAQAGGTPRSVMFTSARASEGKTSTSIAIAADFLSIGSRVVVIDADLRKPSLEGVSPGLSAVLTGASSLEDALVTTASPNMFLLPAGRVPPNPTALMTGQAIVNLIRELEHRFDLVVVDGPPVLGFADAPLLAGVVEVTALVVAAKSTPRSAAQNAIARLEATGGKIIGGILNKFDPKSDPFSYGGAGYGYDYKYGGTAPKRSLIAPPPPSPVG
jgi:capsular exopolysaccharide synthesis family protein